MSNINLLPWRESAKERQKQSFFILIGVSCAIAAVGVFAVNQYFNHQISAQDQRNQYLQHEIAILDTEIGQINVIKAQKQSLVNRMKLIDTLQQSRNVSVRLFNDLPLVIANGVYLQSLNFTQPQINVVGKAEAYNRVASTMRLIDGSGWLGQTAISSIFANDSALMKLSEFSMRFSVLNNNKPNSAVKQ
ncbi:PilN domain-containing protein [Tolumonas lignilytica]|jgi:Tfp pilus assembly protein PilN|uniref:PilN domain-containing protein n=1 Tax=Tolumonas lignilytica TaxID=1283284 RepID=UPI0004633A61|nr:PilN domain-containing protein [Tolumonas lignilytica]